MREISKDTKATLKEGDVVVVCKGGSKIPCIARRCGNTPCTSCVLQTAIPGKEMSECARWVCMLRLHSVYTASAAFVPVEDAVE